MTNTYTAATSQQLDTIRARAVNDEARAMMARGVTLTHEQADDLGEEALGWIGGRLGLNVRETDRGVECTPPAHYSGEEARRAGIEVSDEADASCLLTADTITNAQIDQLEDEAACELDHVQVGICRIALDAASETTPHGSLNLTDEERARLRRMTRIQARKLCADAINNARAQTDAS
jgi:hypothetical protein